MLEKTLKGIGGDVTENDSFLEGLARVYSVPYSPNLHHECQALKQEIELVQEDTNRHYEDVKKDGINGQRYAQMQIVIRELRLKLESCENKSSKLAQES